MNGIWTAFAIMICFVFAILGWQVFNNPGSLILLVLGILCLLRHPKVQQKRAAKKAKKTQDTTPRRKDSLKAVGLILIALALGQNISFWFLLLIIFFFMVLVTGTNTGWSKGPRSLGSLMPWNRKAYIAPDITTDAPKDLNTEERQVHHWFGDTTIGEQIYTWDDINLSVIAGDTIIDLGNTLLPTNRENVILLRKSFGRTRILVPVGTKVRINHSVLLGKLTLDEQQYNLKNETINMTLNDQEDSRELRIITNVLIGDLEVIYV
ncbi:cell wall-active antibiotics response protein LiaF [Agrilactobacillus yilanensis]|uniref:Cell wall-active antibiotics response protein LiaF n=1 Tax=Agrilactobacillus yilanensis TaxID=2485997 RepID=A0ABW4JBG3_9LACO|nr:cell wall-active antibiotics response protein LiaF [Agrilactobacillus yilanensis]